MGEVVLRKTQAALETVRGTDLAATRKVYGKGTMNDKPKIIQIDDEQRGTFVSSYRSQPGLVDASFPFEGEVTYEDLAWWLQLALKGGVTGALSAVTVYTYTFVPTQATDDLKSATFEWGDDTQAWEAHFGMVDKFEISAALGDAIRFKADILVDDWSTTTFTGAISDRVTEDAVTHMSKFAIGAAGAVPAGYVTGRFIGWKLTIQNNLKPKFFADGTASSPASIKYTGMGRQKRQYMLEATFEGNAATITEKASFDAATPRVARVTTLGSIIAGSTGNVQRSIDIVLPGIWTSYDVGDRDTNTIFTGVLESQYDATLGYDISVAVANALVTLP
jgi:hypothetical protein